MKIVIELNDEDLRNAVDQKVSQAIAEMANNAIEAKIDNILGKKFERVDDKRIDSVLAAAAAKVFADSNRGYKDLESKINNALAGAARELVRNQSRYL
ncbi:MAG: hypothetical protein V4772_08795 [Pseudomonadota bacterium]